MTKATASAAGTSGLVPVPAAGKQNAFLRGDATWVELDHTVNMTQRPTTSASKTYLLGTANGPTTTALQISTIADTKVYMTGSGDSTKLWAPIFNGSGAELTALNATNITSGTLADARLADSGATAGSYGQAADKTVNPSGTFAVPRITVDAKGRVTAASNSTITLPADTMVTQAPSSYTGFRPILMGYDYNTDPTLLCTDTVTNQAYTSSKLYVKPSSGAIFTQSSYFSPTGGVISTSNGVPEGSDYVPMIWHNGVNLWVGSYDNNNKAVVGEVYIFKM